MNTNNINNVRICLFRIKIMSIIVAVRSTSRVSSKGRSNNHFIDQPISTTLSAFSRIVIINSSSRSTEQIVGKVYTLGDINGIDRSAPGLISGRN